MDDLIDEQVVDTKAERFPKQEADDRERTKQLGDNPREERKSIRASLDSRDAPIGVCRPRPSHNHGDSLKSMPGVLSALGAGNFDHTDTEFSYTMFDRLRHQLQLEEGGGESICWYDAPVGLATVRVPHRIARHASLLAGAVLSGVAASWPAA